jgi:hypothetical protein
MTRCHTILPTVFLVTITAITQAREIGFIEEFSLAEDRAEALKQLIPGTEDYYFYHCLHYQQTGDRDAYAKTLALWIKRHKTTVRVREMVNRQALLDYEDIPEASLKHIIDELDLRFNHTRQITDQEPSFPTRLDSSRISIETLLQRAFSRNSNLEEIENAGLDILPFADLNPNRLRHLLQRARRPDIPDLPKLVVTDLKNKHSGGFGSHSIHANMLLSQLDECARLMPRLRDNQAFVNAYITKLAPSDDVDALHDPVANREYVNRLVDYTGSLAPAFTSLKAHSLYHKLRIDRSSGTYDPKRFMEYIQLPRNVNYMSRDHLRATVERNIPKANLSDPFDGVTLLPAVEDDEPLVRDYLSHFFIEANDYKAYETFIRENYLKGVFAETKIVNGIGDMEQWYSLMKPAEYQALRERIDLEFSHTNPEHFAVDDDVQLKLHVKNIDTLILKVFRINAFNFYRINHQPITTGLDLDGLVAEDETVFTYQEPDLRRVERTFDLPRCKEPGVYAIEWIGSGVSSRAIVRKGRLHMTERTGPSGHELRIYDESNRPRPDAVLWLQGTEYTPDEDGAVTVPFSTIPGRRKVILNDGDRCSLAEFDHLGESYELHAGAYVDRESLLKGQEAEVIFRPTLALNGVPVGLSLLEDVRLRITSTDLQGVSSSIDVPDFALKNDDTTTHRFKVPDGLTSIHFDVSAKVENMSRQEEQDVADKAEFRLNEIDNTLSVDSVHLSRADGAYRIFVLGKNGEPKPDAPVNLELKHRYFKQTVHMTLQTGGDGMTELGELGGITYVMAKTASGAGRIWHMTRDRYPYAPALHAGAKAPVRIPYSGPAGGDPRLLYSLFELRGETYVTDRSRDLRYDNGFLVVDNLPAGNYELTLKHANHRIRIRLTEGAPDHGYILSPRRVLQRRNSNPLQLARPEVGSKEIRIRVLNPTSFTRVHVVATQFLPGYSLFDHLTVSAPGERAFRLRPSESQYVAERNIGDEYRYILNRRYATRFPGNMLNRPELLLNPWSIRKTQTAKDEAAEGEAFADMPAPSESFAEELLREGSDESVRAGGTVNLDFLRLPSLLLSNLTPDENGMVTIERERLGPRTQIHVAAVDPLTVAYRETSLKGETPESRDLRLPAGLDPNVQFTEQKSVASRSKGEALELADLTTSELELYDSLPAVFNLYATLSGNPTLEEFRFLLRWHEMDAGEKHDLYSRYACHELSFFLFYKDKPFFDAIVKPYLANKKDKTFLDQWLLGEDLTGHLDAWAFGRLNAVERILMAQRGLPGLEGVRRDTQDRFDLIVPDADALDHLLNTALRGSAMETSDRLGFEGAKMDAKKEVVAARRKSMRARGGDSRVTSAPQVDTGDRFAYSLQIPEEETLAVAGGLVSFSDNMPPAKANEIRRELKDRDADEVFFGLAKGRRAGIRSLFRQLDKTEEWVENNYYKLPIEQQVAGLIRVNAFWNDYAGHDGTGPFTSPNFIHAAGNFAEMILALSVLDLPFKPPDHETETEGLGFTLKAAGPALIAVREIRRGEPVEDPIPLLVSENFFRADDRYRFEGNEQYDKFVTDECLVRTAYGSQVVLTNPTSTRRKLRVLAQIPEGSLPLRNGFFTRAVPVNLEPYSTFKFEYYFYFPEDGDFPHYPAHVALGDRFVTSADGIRFNVVENLSALDTASWDYVSQNGSTDDVVNYLDSHNIHRLDLTKIAWRMKKQRDFRKFIIVLSARRAFDRTLWSYALLHNELPAAREYLRHSAYVSKCGAWIESPLLTIDPVARHSYQHMEYKPLVHARAHMLGKHRKILNDRLYGQYHRFMNVLSYKRALDAPDRLGVAYYLLLQDRVEEGISFFDSIRHEDLHEALQYDYLKLYVDFYRGSVDDARAVVDRYANHPVPAWQKRFSDAGTQLAELSGSSAAISDKRDREQLQGRLAATEPALEFHVEDGRIRIDYQNLAQCVASYYPMDIELLFSKNPFVRDDTGHFAYINPRRVDEVGLQEAENSAAFDLPEEFQGKNVMIEVTAAGIRKSQAYYANELSLHLVENYGIVHVARKESREPLPKTYVKVYARMTDGSVRFFKDGYTDLRGKFDYVSLSTNDLDAVEQFALLILHDEHGAVIREAAPPKR